MTGLLVAGCKCRLPVLVKGLVPGKYELVIEGQVTPS
jgi:hypothetical protein